MDDEDGRCLLDVICDPQALNDFLHGSEKLDGDDLLDNPGEAQSAFYEGPGDSLNTYYVPPSPFQCFLFSAHNSKNICGTVYFSQYEHL